LVIVFVLAGMNILLFSLFIQGNNVPRAGVSPVKETEMNYPELDYLRTSPLKYFEELSRYFSGLAKEKGGAYAYEVLKRAPIPPGTDVHLLAHVVGDILYEQKGLEGIKVCTEDFRNACSHSIVIGLFFEQGEEALPQISKACYEAPGGSGAYTMCFHGLGHGILAYALYNLKEAVELCTKTGTAQYGYQESSQCIGGTIMEMIGGGAHDPDLWQEQRPHYFKKDTPLYPCSSDLIPNTAKSMCYVYLTPHLFEAAGADLANPMPQHYEKAFEFCDKIPFSEFGNRDACYGGFGKEFVVLAQDRDIRNIAVMTKEQLKNVYEWCLLADDSEGTISCLRHATNSLYWGGENDRGAAILFCSVLKGPSHQRPCFANLIGQVQSYIQDAGYRKEFCKEIPNSYQEECRLLLLP